MNDKWRHYDLKLIAEKKMDGQAAIEKEEWTVHVPSLADGDQIIWNRYGGYYRTPYGSNEDAYRFYCLSTDHFIRLRISKTSDQEITLGINGKWTSAWDEGKDGCSYRITIRVIESLYPVSELPEGVRTREQIDADAWAYAVRNNLIPHN